MIPDGLVVCPRYRLVVATLPLRPSTPPAPARTGAETAEILVTAALGVLASVSIVLGLVWAAFAVPVT